MKGVKTLVDSVSMDPSKTTDAFFALRKMMRKKKRRVRRVRRLITPCR
jgi:hypothetical protein